jgi:hypothetical protein
MIKCDRCFVKNEEWMMGGYWWLYLLLVVDWLISG